MKPTSEPRVPNPGRWSPSPLTVRASRCPKAPRSCVRRWRPARKFQSSARPTWWMHSARAGSAWSKSKAARERPISVPEGTSIMRAAMEAGTQIPKLCATDMVDAFGSCRLCLVEIEGRAGTPASCTTPAMNGLVVHTQTDRLKKLRKGVMELYISDHPLDCLTCAANGDCELQDMAGAVGLRDVRYGYEGENHVFEKTGS